MSKHKMKVQKALLQQDNNYLEGVCTETKTQIIYGPNAVDCTCVAVVGYRCVPGLNGPHGLTGK